MAFGWGKLRGSPSIMNYGSLIDSVFSISKVISSFGLWKYRWFPVFPKWKSYVKDFPDLCKTLFFCLPYLPFLELYFKGSFQDSFALLHSSRQSFFVGFWKFIFCPNPNFPAVSWMVFQITQIEIFLSTEFIFFKFLNGFSLLCEW
jgi:hypothetical protein